MNRAQISTVLSDQFKWLTWKHRDWLRARPPPGLWFYDSYLMQTPSIWRGPEDRDTAINGPIVHLESLMWPPSEPGSYQQAKHQGRAVKCTEVYLAKQVNSVPGVRVTELLCLLSCLGWLFPFVALLITCLETFSEKPSAAPSQGVGSCFWRILFSDWWRAP